MDLDYQRFGRQIALPEVGADGQRALGTTAVRFVVASSGALGVCDLAAVLHRRAGGLVGTASGAVTVTLPAAMHVETGVTPAALGVAAWGAVEAARRVLALGAEAEVPAALLARLGAPEGAR